MACSSSLLMFKLENVESRNPLECLVCDREFSSPVRLSCQHSYCRDCIQNRKTCPVCCAAIDGDACPDNLLSFLIETSHETADLCANCDEISQPMHFCETCQQALCEHCKRKTHQARMFASHRVVPLEERARVKGRITCPVHGEPYILYSVESRTLACIVCFNNSALDSRHHLVHIDAAHKLGCEKLDKATVKLRTFLDDVREQFQLRKRLAAELTESHRSACGSIRQTCQEMIDTLLAVRDRLLRKLDDEMTKREQHFREQMRQLTALQPTIRLCLLSASIFCSSASKIDFLQCSPDLLKRIQSLMAMQCEKPKYTGDLTADSREEFSRALEPFLGLSTILLSTGKSRTGENNDRSCGAASPRCAQIKRSGSGYANNCQLLLSKYQLVVDLAGAFGEQFARVEMPLRQYSAEMTKLGKKVQELQRDLTLRRCIIEEDSVHDLIRWCKDLDVRVGQHAALVNDLQPQLQQIWQEQLDRVRRQQVLFREKIEETITLRENARHVLSAAMQLEPYAVCLAAVSSVIDRKRCSKPEPAPMETICQQINTIEPDSQQRIEAIEKEEQNRRIAQDQKKREEQQKIVAVKKNLKVTKEQKKLMKRTTRDCCRVSRPPLVNTNRDRSRGGTDRALLSPCCRRHKSSVGGSRSQSDAEVESSLDDSFEFVADSAAAEVETTKMECEHQVYSSQPFRLPAPLPIVASKNETLPPSSLSLPDDDVLSKQNAGTDMENCHDADCCAPASGTGIIPQAPFVPESVFVHLKDMASGTWEAREKVLESLKQRVTRVEVDNAVEASDRASDKEAIT